MADLNGAYEYLQTQIQELKVENKDLSKRISKVEQSKEKTEYQFEQIMEAIKKLNDETIPGIVKQIEELKDKPVKRYETGISALISAIVAGLVAFGMNKLGGN